MNGKHKSRRSAYSAGAVYLFLGVTAIYPAAAQQVTIKETPPTIAEQAPVSAADQAAARKHIARGNSLRDGPRGGDEDGAAVEYRLALRRDPLSAEAHYDLAGVLQDEEETEACILEYQQAIHLDMPDPNGPARHALQTANAYRQLGSIRQEKNQLISAVANFRASLRLAPNDVPTLVNLGDALYDRQLYSSSLTEYQTALRLDPQGRSLDLVAVHVSLGNCLGELNQHISAVHEYRTAVRLSPNDDVAHFDLGLELNILGRYPEAGREIREAGREIREAIRLNPRDAVSHYELGWILYNSGQEEAGRIEWRKVLRMGDPNQADAAREALADHPS